MRRCAGSTRRSRGTGGRAAGASCSGARASAPTDRVFFPFSFGLFVGFWAGFDGARALGALAIPGGGQDSRAAPGRHRDARRDGGLLHAVLRAAPGGGRRASAASTCTSSGVRTTVHAGEPGAGIPSVRARIEEAWGARAYDHAGMTEMGAYGFECAAQARPARERVRVHRRGHRSRHGAPAAEGELVLTNLGRAGSPLLRYRTGDRVRAGRTARARAAGPSCASRAASWGASTTC